MSPIAPILPILLFASAVAAQAPASEPRVTAPRTTRSPELADALRMFEAMAEKGADGKALLAEQHLSPLREVSSFRQLVRERATTGEVAMSPVAEPGTAMLMRGKVVDGQGKAVVGAIVYAYHTDHRGWYSDRAPHFSGDGGDFAHARLFAYVKTDDQGGFVLRSIRPAGYPRSTLPQHVHWQVFVADASVAIGEVWFGDDERLTKTMRAGAGRGVVVVEPKKDGGGIVVEPVLQVVLPPAPPKK